MGQRNAGREHERRDPAPVELAQIFNGKARTCRMSDAVLAVVPAHHIGPAGGERAGSNHPGAAQAEHGNFFAGERSDGDHGGIPGAIPNSRSPG
jgi:hypothetical protein